MPNYSEYFDRVCYKPTWHIGDRVSGYHGPVLFIGTVGNDTLFNYQEGPRVSVFLDLPIRVNNEYRRIIIVKPNDLKRLKSMDDEESLKLPEAGSIPVKRTKSNREKK